MPSLTVYRLTFQSGFHIGTRGVNLEEAGVCIPSDTLFAALVDVFRRTGGEPYDFVTPFTRPGLAENTSTALSHVGERPFLLTSAFPFAGAVHFFPMPVGLQRFFREETLKARRKELKRIRFVSDALFRRILEGEALDEWLFPKDERAEPTDGVALQGGTFWLTKKECDHVPEVFRKDQKTKRRIPLRALRRQKVFASAQVPRVTIDRVASASEIFHAGRVTFASGCGLWFGVTWQKPQATVGQNGLTYRAAFAHILAMLAEEGIGGERSVGYGAFACKEEVPLVLGDPAPGGLALLLSRYHPQKAELPAVLSDDGTAYDLTPVGGWLRSWDGAAQRRKRLWLVAEGSVVRAVGPGILGDVVDVRPTYENSGVVFPHPVWRYGLALGVALREVSRD